MVGSLAKIAVALLTPEKLQRQRNAIVFRAHRFTSDPGQVGQELLAVFERTAYGARSREDSLDIFVDDALAKLSTPGRIQPRREPE